MNGHSAINIFTDAELELHRQVTALVEGLPEVPWTRCHELVRAVATIFRHNPLRASTVDGKFGIVDHSWLVLRPRNPWGRHIILDVYAVGSVPLVQLHDTGTLSIRGARAFVEGLPRDDIDYTAIEVLLHHMKQQLNCHPSSPL